MAYSYLSSHIKSISIKSNPIKMAQSYWVYVHQSIHSNTRDVISLLNKYDYTKYYIVDHGPYKNYISLGLFKKRSDAKRLLTTMHKYGVNAKFKKNFIRNHVYWIDFVTDVTNSFVMNKLTTLDVKFNNILRVYQGFDGSIHKIMWDL